MTKVYQTIFSSTRGNCMAAVWATLLNLDLNKVPNFVEEEDDHDALCKFIKPFGLEYAGYLINGNRKDLLPEKKAQYCFLNHGLPIQESVNGYFDATVYSPGYFNYDRYLNDPDYKPVCHAVVCDVNLNIVHDPNPNYAGFAYPLEKELGCRGIIGVSLYRKINELVPCQ